MLKFAIIGAGAGGQSMAAILTSKGYIAKLYDIDKEKIHRLQELKTIKVTGVIACEAAPAVITDRIDEVMVDIFKMPDAGLLNAYFFDSDSQ